MTAVGDEVTAYIDAWDEGHVTAVVAMAHIHFDVISLKIL